MKRVVLCCDGTWNKPDEMEDGVLIPTNVVKLACNIAKRDGDILQIIHYDLGVGTGNFIDKALGGVLGDGLEDNVHDAYRFLIANYEPGDEVYLFGFSRGAYTARSIGGMIRKCGVLRRGAVDKYPDAKELYRSGIHPDDPAAVDFRKKFSVSPDAPIRIKCIGVFDTVGSLGIPKAGGVTESQQFHDTELSSIVENAFHALAIDENRSPFQPTLWDDKPKPEQKVEQVWFCGAHSDVGGGYLEAKASDIALDWMLKKASSVGLKLDEEAGRTYPITIDPFGPLHDSKKGIHWFGKRVFREIGLAKNTGQPDATQHVHESVYQRWDADPFYRPPSLLDYFRRVGDLRGR